MNFAIYIKITSFSSHNHMDMWILLNQKRSIEARFMIATLDNNFNIKEIVYMLIG